MQIGVQIDTRKRHGSIAVYVRTLVFDSFQQCSSGGTLVQGKALPTCKRGKAGYSLAKNTNLQKLPSTSTGGTDYKTLYEKEKARTNAAESKLN